MIPNRQRKHALVMQVAALVIRRKSHTLSFTNRRLGSSHEEIRKPTVEGLGSSTATSRERWSRQGYAVGDDATPQVYVRKSHQENPFFLPSVSVSDPPVDWHEHRAATYQLPGLICSTV
jgi:hypothetical protein